MHNLALKSYTSGILKTTCSSLFNVRLGKLPVMRGAFQMDVAISRDRCVAVDGNVNTGTPVIVSYTALQFQWLPGHSRG